MLLPQPLPPDKSMLLDSGNPPSMSSSRPGMPVVSRFIEKGVYAPKVELRCPSF